MRAKLLKTNKTADDIYTYWFSAQKPVDNVPGQYTEIYLPHSQPDDRGEHRKFTIFSSPTEDNLAITIRIRDVHCSTFKRALLNIKLDDVINYSQPIGDFVLPINKLKSVIFVSSGKGYTPVRSIIKWLSDTNQKRDISILQAVRSKNEIIDKQLFDKFHTEYFVGKSKLNELQTRMLALIREKPNCLVYISGSPTFIEQINSILKESGLNSNQVVTDIFDGY